MQLSHHKQASQQHEVCSYLNLINSSFIIPKPLVQSSGLNLYYTRKRLRSVLFLNALNPTHVLAANKACLQLGQHPVLKEYVDKISVNIFERPVPIGAASMSQEWSQRAQAAAKGPR